MIPRPSKPASVPEMQATSEDVRYAYRLLLGREPDAVGFEHYVRSLRGTTSTELAELFLGSAEFAARRHLRGELVEVDFDGYSLFVRDDDNDVGRSVTKGVYEPHVTAIVREVLRTGDTFVDVGANIGYYAAMGAHLVGPQGRVVAIEPMDKNVQLISSTIWVNHFENVQVLPYAASSNTRVVPMATGPRTSNGEVVRARGDGRLPTLFAHARRLDDMLRDLNRLDLIKFDIEGHELPAWRGFAHGMDRHNPLVLTEFHPKCMRDNAGVEPAEYLDVLFAYAQSVEVLLGPAERVQCGSAADVMSQWEAADRRLRSGGTTHLDLFVRPKAR